MALCGIYGEQGKEMSVKVIRQRAVLTDSTEYPAGKIEKIARICYRSGEQITHEPDDTDAFIRKLIARGHHSPFEHAYATLYIVTNRAIANELVRHRHASYMQESTRYVRYDELEIIPTDPNMADWEAIAELHAECRTPPQIARDVLPLCTATRMYMTANLRAWREILVQRLAPACHPQMQELAKMMLEAVRPILPVYFEGVDNGKG